MAISNTRVAPQGTLNKVSGNLVSRGRVYSHRAQLLTEEKERKEAWSFLVVIKYIFVFVYLFIFDYISKQPQKSFINLFTKYSIKLFRVVPFEDEVKCILMDLKSII